uniref:ShKT domain-containing protein n=1 Tax=Panagrolaimus sp. PS1159 TaxID=55785 RepID=A0AC35EU44_9BILA
MVDQRNGLYNSKIEYLSNGTVISNPFNNTLPFNNITSKCGFYTPRVSYYNGFYYLLYAEYDCNNGVFSLAKTTNPMDVKSWEFLGHVVTNITMSIHATILWATPDNGLSNHYLFCRQNGTEIYIAVSNDPLNWEILNKTILKRRYDHFDNTVIPSVMPLRLKTDDFLFIYGGMSETFMIYTGWAILDAKDPTNVVQRCEDPLMTPTSWEFDESLITTLLPDPYGCPLDVANIIGTEYAYNAECFFGFYFSYDNVGVVRVVSSWIDNDAQVSTPSSCTDIDSNCQSYSERCSNPLYLPLMCKYCQKACNLCDNQACKN